MDKVTKFSKLLAKVSRVAYTDLPEGQGVADVDNNRPPQREWACIVDTAEGPQVVCSIYSVGTKVLTVQPYTPARMCAVCEMLDAYVDDQNQLDGLLKFVMINADEIEPATPEDEELCELATQFLCDRCRSGQSQEEVRPPQLILN